ncbi:hypothetical protein PbB2_01749 [Candidatus Phycosocius bacilliformis]|uniref:Outer membrane protein beta-barrel domain-containing protein n=1 Tax=Candidatus Phycosocius bacilliformis TaxID=1445552 RepID=A0A2P2EAH9_9PROT|nr:hypothetical protein [Candidatus Phycosocius bacilliformis]GBF58078.1 hypothetical protein PbB2_01749 [Candidatus Phycosocius bacilliformis]
MTLPRLTFLPLLLVLIPAGALATGAIPDGQASPPAPAQAALACSKPGERLTGAALRQRLIVQAGLPLNEAVLAALEGRSLGALADQSSDPALTRLMADAEALLAQPGVSGGQEASTPPTNRRAQATAFLNGVTEGIGLTCPAPTLPAAPPVLAETVVLPAKPAHHSRHDRPPRRGWILADSKDDFIKPARERAFATLGFEEDKAADTRLLNASLALALDPLLLGKPSSSTELRWTPFIQYNRRAARSGREEVNDLTLGTSFIFRNPDQVGRAVGFGSAAFQTDDTGQAAVWVADALIDFPRLRPCTRRSFQGWRMRCNLSVVLDFASVEDPGESQKLAELDTYFRGGLNLGLSGEQKFSFGVVVISSSFNGRYDLITGDASGGLFSIGAGLRASEGSNLSLEARYTRGTTINSLVDVDKITLRLGYRL